MNMKASPAAPADESLLFNNCYQGKKKISAGSFGTVYSGVDIRNNESIAIKIEKVVGEEMRSVIREGTFLKKLEGIRGIPKVFWTGSKGDQDVLVITLLGKDLASFLKIYKKFSLKTVVMIADQLLTLLEQIHAKNLLHRDIKPENILVGRGDQADTIFYVDFGISKYYKDSLGRHIPFRDKKSFIGTTRYASIAAHLGNEISRKDDLESLAYVIIFLAKGILPWQNLNVSESEKTKKVGELKVKTPVEELCKGLPEEFGKYLIYVKNLTFKENPDYNYLKGLLLKVAMTHDITMDSQWDWVTPLKIENKIPNKKKSKNPENDKKSREYKKKDQEEKMNIIIKKETMGKKKFSQDINSSVNNISPMGSPKGSFLKLGGPEDFMAAVQLQLQVPDLLSNNNTSYASSYRGSSVCLKYEFTSKGYPDDIFDCNEDCKEFVSSNLASAIQSLENTKVKTRRSFSTLHTPFLIIGAGAAGINVMGHLLRQRGITPQHIRLLDPSKFHHYQPGWTMIGGGLCDGNFTLRESRHVVGKWVPQEYSAVKSFDPEKNLVFTEDERTFSYDHLIIASGIKTDFDKIKGAQEALEDPDCPVGSIYNHRYAIKFNKFASQTSQGRAIFCESTLPIKCGGAPQKIVFLSDDRWRKNKTRDSIEMVFRKAANVYFPVPRYAAELEKFHKAKNIASHLNSNIIEINKKDRIAIFQNPATKELTTEKFDLLHVVPPQSTHDFIKKSVLANKESGFIDVDISSLQHKTYKNVWALGDNANLPTSKTAAAVMSQGPILVRNLMRVYSKQDSEFEKYDGYTSCPIFTGNNKLMLAEFKYNNEVDETFFNNQNIPRRSFFYLKRWIFPLVYFHLMPRGYWLGKKGFGTALL